MSSESVPTTVAEALAAVQSWRSSQQVQHAKELAEVTKDLQSMEAALENLRQQVESLRALRDDLTQKATGSSSEVGHRSYTEIFDVLNRQAESLAQRSTAVAAAASAHWSQLPQLLDAAGLADVRAEYEQFKQTVEPTLKDLPDSYKSAMMEVHQQQASRLRDAVKDLPGVPEVEGDPVSVDIVFGLDAPEGAPELLVVVLPVPESVHEQWGERASDLPSSLMARVVEAVYRAASDVGFLAVQPLAGGHLGLVAIEVELLSADPKVLEGLRERLAAVTTAPELQRAKVELTVQEVNLDFLLPPEEDEEAGDE